jgi:hypothetical protein
VETWPYIGRSSQLATRAKLGVGTKNGNYFPRNCDITGKLMKPMAGLFSETEKGLTVCVEG